MAIPRTLVVINPVSGPARRGSPQHRLEVARSTLAKLGVVGDVQLTARAGHAYQMAMEGVRAGCELVIAWGGDGTINDVARAIVEAGEHRVSLGIVPGGSGNGLARQLGIPFEPASALERALTSDPWRIDAGELGGHLFLNVAGIGLDGHVAEIVARVHSKRGLLPYMLASARDLLKYAPASYSVEAEGKSFRMRGVVVVLANSAQYGFNARIAPGADPRDGLLDLVAIEDRGVAGNIWRLPSLFTGRLDRRAGVRTSKVAEVLVRSDRPMLYHVDGEFRPGGLELAGRVIPQALHIRA